MKSALWIKNCGKTGLHFVGDIPGLALKVSPAGSKSWILRYSFGCKRRDMGLGPYPEVSLLQAKDLAYSKRAMVRQGIDPIALKLEALRTQKQAELKTIIFDEASQKYIEAHSNGWKNAKHGKQWVSTLAMYASPVFGAMAVREIDLSHVLKVLEPIWYMKPETAKRLRGRIEAVLDWAAVRGFREGTNPARWKGNLAMLLPTRAKVKPVKHFKALAWQEMPQLMEMLSNRSTTTTAALIFVIATVARSGEVRAATWEEVDLDNKVWTIPAARMKAGKEHRIPLNEVALAILKSRPNRTGLLFSNFGKMLSDMALTKFLRDKNIDCTVHGFRSTFRDWAGETTSFPREVIEHALAHQLKDKAEAAYARGDLFHKRTALMQAWANFMISAREKPSNIAYLEMACINVH